MSEVACRMIATDYTATYNLHYSVAEAQATIQTYVLHTDHFSHR